MKEFINKYRLSLIPAILLGILIFIRSTGTGHFRYDARKWAEPSLKGTNLVSFASAASLNGDKLLVTFNRDQIVKSDNSWKKVYIPADSVLDKKYRKTIEDHKGQVLLYGTDSSVPARIWMILSQKGLKNIYIVMEDPANETVKEKFRIDTLANPESK
jgi:hypothetical protein